MQHRRQTGPAAHARARRSALGILLACCALGGTALAAAGGSSTDPAAAVLQVARQQIGDAYVWGGTGPDGWDCSGLTSRLWREVGGVTSIPRVSRDQQAWAVPIPAEQAQIGDLVFFGNPVSHVALYAGAGTIVDASSSQRGVVERKVWTSGVIRYGRVPRPGMPAVTPWTPPVLPSPPPAPAPAVAATAPATPAGSSSQDKPSAAPVAKPVSAPAPRESSAPAALTTEPLRGLPAPDLAALTPVSPRAAANARSVRGSRSWTDVELVRAAWRHAGGGPLPATRAELVAAGTAVPLADARVGDVVVYGIGPSHVGLYLGHGYLVDASASLGRVVVRRVYASPTVRFVRLPVAAVSPPAP